MFHVPNKNRITPEMHPILGSYEDIGNNGAFVIYKTNGRTLFIIASDASNWDLGGIKWEHVSVHVKYNKRNQLPSWTEMCEVKNIFWDDEDVVIQFHPKKSEYVNNHDTTLHLWRPIDFIIPTPPTITVGIKDEINRTRTESNG